MSTGVEKYSYHHGDLRATLLNTALEMLEDGDAFSLRALARRAGVSATAPYRHFADRDALESALAVDGLREMLTQLSQLPVPQTPEGLADVAVGYVEFALRQPALFRLMFGGPCDDTDDDRVIAAAALHDYLEDAVGRVFPQADVPALATAAWGLAHGLAFLHLDGKLANSDPVAINDRVRQSFTTITTLGVTS